MPTPAQLGYSMPPEWHPHHSTWLAFPRNRETFPELEAVQGAFIEIIRCLLPGERVDLLTASEAEEQAVRGSLAGSPGLENLVCHRVETVDSWIRDFGPTFLLQQESGSAAMIDWTFNAWGGKYEDLRRDDRVPRIMEGILGLPRFRADFILEGGAIEVNGRGVCLTTEQCLFNPNRNPGMSKRQIEALLGEWLGAKSVVWLGDGIVGDDTDGHVDDIARFVSPEVVVCSVEEDPTDANHHLLQDNLRRLKSARDNRGEPFRIETLPMPDPIFADRDRLPASYANFYIANQVVLMPVYGQAKDARALEILQGLFPDHRVKGVPCREMVRGLGAIHCVTQQQPTAEVDADAVDGRHLFEGSRTSGQGSSPKGRGPESRRSSLEPPPLR